MKPSDSEHELRSETTEQALARVEAECGWSDVGRFADALVKPPAVAPASDADRAER